MSLGDIKSWHDISHITTRLPCFHDTQTHLPQAYLKYLTDLFIVCHHTHSFTISLTTILSEITPLRLAAISACFRWTIAGAINFNICYHMLSYRSEATYYSLFIKTLNLQRRGDLNPRPLVVTPASYIRQLILFLTAPLREYNLLLLFNQ